jgi:hypothetical protein
MTWLQAIVALLGVIRDFFHAKENADARQAGRDEANASTRAQNDERVKEAGEAEIEADKDHKTMPGDEAFDTEFRRD